MRLLRPFISIHGPADDSLLSAASLNFISSFLWGNAGFGSLRNLKALDDFEPRYDPTVIPIPDHPQKDFRLDALDGLSVESTQRPHTGPCGVLDYHAAYKSGELTPTAVAKALLQLVSSSSKHSTAFLQIREAQVLGAAEKSTRRYRDGISLSILDGVPVAVKDEVDLDGYTKSFGSAQDFTLRGGGTSWCVKKWEEAGAVIIGKLNMHEFGLGKTIKRGKRNVPLTMRKTLPTTIQPKERPSTRTINTTTLAVLPADPGTWSAPVWFPLRWALMAGARSASQLPFVASTA